MYLCAESESGSEEEVVPKNPSPRKKRHSKHNAKKSANKRQTMGKGKNKAKASRGGRSVIKQSDGPEGPEGDFSGAKIQKDWYQQDTLKEQSVFERLAEQDKRERKVRLLARSRLSSVLNVCVRRSGLNWLG